MKTLKSDYRKDQDHVAGTFGTVRSVKIKKNRFIGISLVISLIVFTVFLQAVKRIPPKIPLARQ